MDRRNWPWKKKPAEKIITADPGNSIPKQKPYEQQNSGDSVPENGLDMTSPSVLATKVKELKEQVQRMTAEMKANDDVVKQHEKVAEEAVTGWEKAEADSISLKQQLEQVMQKKAEAEERVSQLDGALKECVRQLRTVKEEQETAIHDAVKKKATELDAARLELEEKLIEVNQRLSEAVEQNASVSGALQETRKFLERLKDEKSQVENEVNQLRARIVFLEKDNASAKHEINLLATQLEIRTEEKEFTRKAAEAAKKQHLESLKKITKLEADCQKLRVLLRKKLPGPGAIAQMKREAEKATDDWRRRPQSRLGHSQENNIRQMQYLSERYLDMEEENSRLRRELENRKGEFHAQAEVHRPSAHANEHFPGPSYAPSHASISEDAEADEASLSGSWASALISELEQFSKEKPTTNSHANQMIKAPEFELMDDFVEMERLATASESTVWPLNQNITEATKTDQRSSCSALSGTGVDVIHEDEARAGSYPDGKGNISGSEREELLCLILDAHSKGQNLDEVLNKVKEALGVRSSNSATERIHKLKEKLTRLKGLGGESLISRGSLDGVMSQQISLGSFSDGNSSEDESDPFSVPGADKRDGKRSRLVTSVQKILRLIESISQSISVDASHSQVSGSVPDYTMRVLQWQNSEFDPVVQKAVEVCNNLLQDTAKIEEFVAGVGSVLEWLADHLFSLKDVSTIRDAIKNQMEWHGESQSNSESETEVESQAPPALKQQNDAAYAETLARKLEEAENLVEEKDRVIGQLKEEVNALNHDVAVLRIQNKNLDARLQEAFKSHDSMNSQRLDSEREISELQTELAVTKGLTESLEDKLEAQITMNEELEVQLRAAIAELNQSREKFTSLQTEIEEKGACFQELEATCLDLQLQLESRNGGNYKDEEPNDVSAVPVADATKDLDISTAARKLAECQKTILDLEKQFKALAGENESNRTLLDTQIEAENPPENAQPETAVPTPEKVVPELGEAKETVAPRSENGEAREAETKPLKKKSGLLYGWQLLPESPASGIQRIDSKDTEQHLNPASPSILPDLSKDDLSNGNDSIRRNSSSNSSRELVPYKPKKRTRAGSFTRFFAFSRRGA